MQWGTLLIVIGALWFGWVPAKGHATDNKVWRANMAYGLSVNA
jgi:hypothetical protein